MSEKASSEHQHKFHQTLILMKILKEMPVSALDVPEQSRDNIRVYKNYLITKDFLFLDKETTLLGISLMFYMSSIVPFFISAMLVKTY